MANEIKISRKSFLSSIGRAALGLTAVGAFLRPSEAEAAEPLPFKLTKSGELDPEMSKLSGVAIDAKDQLHAAGDGIKIFDRGGKLIRKIETSGPVGAVAVDAEGMIYAAQEARIEKFLPDGTRAGEWGELGVEPGQFRHITGIAAGERTIFVADSGARRIHRFSPDGDYAGEISGPAENEQFVVPSAYFDVALDVKGNLHVGHTGRHRVERYDANAQMTGHWGKYGTAREHFCGCCNPTNIAIFADGRIATAEKGVPRLKVYDAAGKLLAMAGADAFPGNAAGMDLAIDSQGRIALVEPIARKIRFYAVAQA